MIKKAITVILILLVGIGLGCGISYYKYTVVPQAKAKRAVEKAQEEVQQMVRHGKLITAKPNTLTMKVDKGGGDIGKTVALRTSEYTSVQVGMDFVNRPGQKLDLTEHFKVGDYVDVLVKDGQALALHRDFRPGEQ